MGITPGLSRGLLAVRDMRQGWQAEDFRAHKGVQDCIIATLCSNNGMTLLRYCSAGVDPVVASVEPVQRPVCSSISAASLTFPVKVLRDLASPYENHLGVANSVGFSPHKLILSDFPGRESNLGIFQDEQNSLPEALAH